MKVLILISSLIVSLSCYSIDFENGDGHLKLESNTLHNGQVVHEPKVEHVIKTLSGIRYKEPHSELTKKRYRHPSGNVRDQVKVEYNDYDVPRIFITNINKNLNSNDLAQENEAESVQKSSYSNNKRAEHDQHASYAY